jgi:hypothetical protein
MAEQRLEQALARLLQRGVDAAEREQVEKSGSLKTALSKDPDDWDDDSWEFANQRGLIPEGRQAEYEARLLDKRHALERAALGAWQGGNRPDSGTATLGVASGQLPVVPERPVAANLIQEVDGPEGAPSEGAPPYEDWRKQELQDEIDARNETRAEEAHVRPASNRKEDMVKALYDDDELEEQRAARTEEPPPQPQP